jgi:phosphomannomutase
MTTENNTYLKLQNGSDIRGVALEGIEGEHVNLDETAAVKIGYAFAAWLRKKITASGNDGDYTLTISVGRDPRLSGEKLAAAFSEGLLKAGVHVYDCGLASTPAMFMSTIFDSFMCDGAVMITASHLPFNRNGFKFFDKSGGLNKEDIKEINNSIEDLQGNKQNFIHLDILEPTWDAPEGDIILNSRSVVIDAQDHRSGYQYVMWRRTNNQWEKMQVAQYSQVDLQAGVSDLPTGEIYLVYE